MTYTFTDFDKAKAKSKKNCVKGMPCGFGCISKTKKCKKRIFGGGGDYADHITNPDNLEKGAESTEVIAPPIAIKPEPIVIETAKDAIAKGEQFLGEDIKEWDKTFKEYNDLEKIIEDPSSGARESVEAKFRFQDIEKQLFEIENKMHDKIMSSGDRDQAKNLSNQIELKRVSKNASDIKQIAEDFFVMSNGKGADTLNTITKTANRAYAVKPFVNRNGETEPNGLINVGQTDTKGGIRKPTLFHEMGHHVEFGNPKYAAAAKDLVMSRATGAEQKLSQITGNKFYSAKEKAFPDKFINPYVGKVYKDGSTEVLSVGVERMIDKTAARDFLRKDRDHFLFTVGILND